MAPTRKRRSNIALLQEANEWGITPLPRLRSAPVPDTLTSEGSNALAPATPTTASPVNICECAIQEPHSECWRNTCEEEALKLLAYGGAESANATAYHHHLYNRKKNKLHVRHRAGAFHLNCKDVRSCTLDYYSFIKKHHENEESAIQFLQDHAVLPTDEDMICENNHPPKKMAIRHNGRYRCNYRTLIRKGKKKAKPNVCGASKSTRAGTIAEDFKIKIWQILLIILEYSKMSFCAETVAMYVGVTRKTLKRVTRKIDEAILQYMSPIGMIGGVNCWVEIDETVYSKRKTQVGGGSIGRPMKMTLYWIIGGCERYGGGRFLVPLVQEVEVRPGETDMEVIQRTAENLIPIIKENVRPGSIVVTDGWTAYNLLGGHSNFKHFVVNHSKEMVNKDDPMIHTQTVERMWRHVKDWIKKPGHTWRAVKSQLARYQLLNPCFMRPSTQAKYTERREYVKKTAFHRLLVAIAEAYRKQRMA